MKGIFFCLGIFFSVFLSAQNVGIGTASPIQKLDVAGNIRADSFLLSAPKTLYYALSSADFGARNTANVVRREEVPGGGIYLEIGTAGLVAPFICRMGQPSLVCRSAIPTTHRLFT
jgi:hypothetical protein